MNENEIEIEIENESVPPSGGMGNVRRLVYGEGEGEVSWGYLAGREGGNESGGDQDDGEWRERPVGPSCPRPRSR